MVSVSSIPLWHHEITLAPQAQSIATVRQFVRGHLVSHGLQPGLADDVELVASELATNALEHARTGFTLSLAATTDTVTVVVQDGSTARPQLIEAQGTDVAGRGMAIVDSLSRQWGVTVQGTPGKAVWAAFDVGQAE